MDVLTHLNLNSIQIDDEGMASLVTCKSLTNFECKSATFTDTGLLALVAQKKPLSSVNFASARITDKGLLALTTNNSFMLKMIIDSATLTSEGISQAKLGSLKEFSLAGGEVKTREVFEAVLKGLLIV